MVRLDRTTGAPLARGVWWFVESGEARSPRARCWRGGAPDQLHEEARMIRAWTVERAIAVFRAAMMRHACEEGADARELGGRARVQGDVVRGAYADPRAVGVDAAVVRRGGVPGSARRCAPVVPAGGDAVGCAARSRRRRRRLLLAAAATAAAFDEGEPGLLFNFMRIERFAVRQANNPRWAALTTCGGQRAAR